MYLRLCRWWGWEKSGGSIPKARIRRSARKLSGTLEAEGCVGLGVKEGFPFDPRWILTILRMPALILTRPPSALHRPTPACRLFPLQFPLFLQRACMPFRGALLFPHAGTRCICSAYPFVAERTDPTYRLIRERTSKPQSPPHRFFFSPFFSAKNNFELAGYECRFPRGVADARYTACANSLWHSRSGNIEARIVSGDRCSGAAEIREHIIFIFCILESYADFSYSMVTHHQKTRNHRKTHPGGFFPGVLSFSTPYSDARKWQSIDEFGCSIENSRISVSSIVPTEPCPGRSPA